MKKKIEHSNEIVDVEELECIHEFYETDIYHKGIKNPDSSTSSYRGNGFVVKCKKCGQEFVRLTF